MMLTKYFDVPYGAVPLRLLENTNPIVLSLMVVLSESYLQHLEHKAMPEALTIQIHRKHLNDM